MLKSTLQVIADLFYLAKSLASVGDEVRSPIVTPPSGVDITASVCVRQSHANRRQRDMPYRRDEYGLLVLVLPVRPYFS